MVQITCRGENTPGNYRSGSKALRQKHEVATSFFFHSRKTVLLHCTSCSCCKWKASGKPFPHSPSTGFSNLLSNIKLSYVQPARQPWLFHLLLPPAAHFPTRQEFRLEKKFPIICLQISLTTYPGIYANLRNSQNRLYLMCSQKEASCLLFTRDSGRRQIVSY